jgi:ribonuclease BN (tRNA processing enzyme)
VGQDVILFDCGGGVFDNLLRAGRRPSDITHLVLSHLHSDHMMDYARLVHAAWDEGAAPIKVYGPAPIAQITEKLFGADGVFADDLRSRTELLPSQEVWQARGGTLPRPWPAPDVHQIEPGDCIAGEGWSLTSCAVPHAQPALTCMGFAVKAENRKFVYSGDAGVCDALTALCADADLLLHWCYRLDGETAHPAMLDLTPTPSQIGTMAQAAGVQRLLLTHFRVHMDEEHAKAEDAMRSQFAGPCGIVEDLQSFEI